MKAEIVDAAKDYRDRVIAYTGTLTDRAASIIRTFVPALIGLLVAWLGQRGIILPEGLVQGAAELVAFVAFAGWYVLVRALEERRPGYGWLLGVPRKPVYGQTLNSTAKSSNHTAASLPDLPLRFSQSSEDIRTLHRLLNNAGAYPSLADTTLFSKQTLMAVRKFQVDNNIEPTGVVDLKTWQTLNK